MELSSSDIFNAVLIVLSIVAIVVLTAKLKFNVFASLFAMSFILAMCTTPLDELIGLLKTSFGNTMGGISFIIIFGAIIGICMERSGAALSIATNILNKAGKSRAKSAMAMTGFIPGMTIFCDTGYLIMSGIARSFSAQSKTPMPLMAAILGLSLFSVHCLVPTHPGALTAATNLNANIGYLVILGALFSIPALIVGCLWANKMSKGMNSAPATLEEEEKKALDRPLPSFFNSLIPVVLPLILISISTFTKALGFKDEVFAKVIHFIGDPVMALLVGAIAGFCLLAKTQKANKDKFRLNEVIEEGIVKAGPILIITAAGGMFGAVIAATGAGKVFGEALASSGGASIGLLVPFIIAVLLKTAQGSSTVAAITTAGIVAPLLGSLGLDSEWGRMLTVLALGAGSVVVSHANDSYFWVITKFSNIDINESLRVYSTSTIVMGLVMFACIFVTSLLVL